MRRDFEVSSGSRRRRWASALVKSEFPDLGADEPPGRDKLSIPEHDLDAFWIDNFEDCRYALL
jgi:hypothetical protein